jgi:SlyX protein
VNEDQRLVEIESKVSHQDLLLEELHKVIYRQQETIDALESKLEKLLQRMRDEFGEGPTSEKPPHY